MSEAFVVERPSGATLRALNYTPEIERLRRRTGDDAIPLQDLLSEIGPAYGSVFVRIDCAPEHGVELITQGDMFAAESSGRVIRRDSMARPDRHLVTRGQILIAGAGTLGETELFGRAIIADDRLVGRYVGPHAMALTFKQPDDDQSLFTYAFLLTSVGTRAIRAASFGTKILGLRKDLLGQLPIPVPPKQLRARVADLVRQTMAHRQTYSKELQAARSAVEGLSEVEEAQGMCALRRSRAITWSGTLPTLSAWNVASAGQALQFLKGKWQGRLGDVLDSNGVFYGPRFARTPCKPPHGVEFMSQRDVFLIRPLPRRIAHPGFTDTKLFALQETLMVAAQGTLGEGELFGRVALVRGRPERTAYTQHLLRLIPKSNTEALFAFLSTLVGLRLLRTAAVGTKLLSLREDLLRALPMPDTNHPRFHGPRLSIDNAYEAKEAADSAEREATRIVEEEVVPAWLT